MSEYADMSTERLRAQIRRLEDEKRSLQRDNDEQNQAGVDAQSGSYEGNYFRMDRIDAEIEEIQEELDRR